LQKFKIDYFEKKELICEECKITNLGRFAKKSPLLYLKNGPAFRCVGNSGAPPFAKELHRKKTLEHLVRLSDNEKCEKCIPCLFPEWTSSQNSPPTAWPIAHAVASKLLFAKRNKNYKNKI